MVYLTPQFSETNSSGGISSLGLNLESFIFQLITFVLVLLILKRFVFSKLVATLEKRRAVLERSLTQAQQTEQTLQQAEAKAANLLRGARAQADEALALATKKAEAIMSVAEASASQRGEQIVKEAEAHIEQQSRLLRQQLKGEMAELVAAACEKVTRQKLDEPRDALLIEQSLREMR